MLRVLGEPHNPLFTLENPKRIISTDSRVDSGSYHAVPHNSAKYPNTYEVLNVPNRTDILLHWGNTEKDTLGCILLGLEIGMLNTDPAVLHSHDALNYLRSLIGEGPFLLRILD